MRIQHNISAMGALRQGNKKKTALEKLASGYQINRAADDAAGLAISEKMRAQITGMSAAERNVQDAVSLIQIAEGALTEVHSMLGRMTELATQASNGIYTSNERWAIQSEMDSMKGEIDRIAKNTNFNDIILLDGRYGSVTTGSGGIGGGGAVYPAYSVDIDFADTRDSAVIMVNGVKFEFDGNYSTQTAGSVRVHIVGNTGSSEANKSARAEAFKDTVLKSVLATDNTITFTDLGSGKVHMKLIAKKAEAEKLDVSFHSVPPMFCSGVGVKILDPDPATFKAEYSVVNVNPFSITDGSTLMINGVLFEFDSKGSCSNPSAVKVEFISYNESLDNLSAALNGSVLGASGDYKLKLVKNSERDVAIVITGTNPAAPITEIAFNTPSSILPAFEVTNLKQGYADDAGNIHDDKDNSGAGLVFQIGESSNDTMRLYIQGSTAKQLGIGNISVFTQESAVEAISVILEAINNVSQNRAGLAAAQNRLEHTMNSLRTTKVNLTDVESRIRDADMAKEMMVFTKENIMVQSAQAMLVHAIQFPEGVLQLLK